MSDKRKGVLDKSNEAHKLLIHRSYLKWNKKYEKCSGKYRINPYHMTTVAAKPNHVDPTQHGNEHYVPTIYRDPIEEAFSSEYLKRTVSRGSMTPGQKYRSPQTSSQEVGWYHTNVIPKHHNNWMHNKARPNCFETYFAVEYLKSVGTSPYKQNQRGKSVK